MSERMPLFPLATVLFPGLLLPLHVFEERYRQLVRDLMDLPADAPRRFGVVAIKGGQEVGGGAPPVLYEVGCMAELRQVEEYEDGRYDLVTRGGTRFRLGGVDTTAEPYLVGDVDPWPEPAGEQAGGLRGAVAGRFAAYQAMMRRLQGQSAGDPPSLPADPVVLSYLVAATMILDLADKQALLAAPDAARRLVLERELLVRETTILTPLPSLPAVDLLRRGVSLN